MRDELQLNYGTITGTPSLVAGALVRDPNQALAFDGSTNKMTVTDSPSSSLAVPNAGPGGMAVECFVRFTALPGVQKKIAWKSGSWEIGITAANKLYFTLTNGASTVTVTSNATVSTNTWYHLVCVHNGDYTGTPQFGYASQGSSQFVLPGDFLQGSATGLNNLQVCQFTAQEMGQITTVEADLQRVKDTTSNTWTAAVLYGADGGGNPFAKIGQSNPIHLDDTVPSGRAWVPYTFPTAAIFFAGPVYLGIVEGNESGQFRIGCETTGGVRKWRNAVVTDAAFHLTGQAPDPFGTVVGGDAFKFSIRANYTPLARTGAEGKALIYINGALDNSAAYTGGVADTANDTIWAPSDGTGCAVQIDEPSIWNRKLTPVEVARHYAAR